VHTGLGDTQISAGTMARRQALLGILILAGLVAIGLKLFQMQVLQQREFIEAAQRNRLEELPQPAPRGEILDRHGRVMATTLPRYDVTYYIPDTLPDDWSWIPRLVELLALSPEASEGWREAIEKAKPFTRVPLAEDVPLARLVELVERQAEYPGIGISTRTKRSYPYAQATSHLLGYLGRVSEPELKRLGPEWYQGIDQTGKGGLEEQYDAHLRGDPGYQYLEVDFRGRVQAVLTDPILLDPRTGESIPAAREAREGPALRTTIDAELQSQVAQAFTGYHGAAVVMDVHDGAVLAAVSAPTYDANLFAGKVSSETAKSLFATDESPVLNRWMGATFIPGSTWKIVTALAGLEEGVITEHTVLSCDGVFRTKGRNFHCHKLSGHGSENVRKALADSCDDYFYQVGVKLGADRISKYARLYGFGAKTGIDLPAEVAGLAPTTQWKLENRGGKWYQGDTLNYAIGQGYASVTPLQMAKAYSFLANGGHPVVPHLNADAAFEVPPVELTINPKHLRIIQEGLRLVVTGGTGRSAGTLPVPIAGKTGTADHVSGMKPHSWFASYAPYDNPQVTVVVIAESAGHGSDAALPVVRKIYQLPAIQQYLEPPAEAQTSGGPDLAQVQSASRR